ncbi:hypothetical protein CI102_1550 [Trichoderma harzianum]|nr:hypothetical protein CI102_1550 [Trichoderma harzianum]
MRLLLAAGGGGLNKVQLSCPNKGIVAVPETDRWTGTLSNDEAKRWRVAEAAQWLRLLSRWPLAFAFLFACGPPDASASNTKPVHKLSPFLSVPSFFPLLTFFSGSGRWNAHQRDNVLALINHLIHQHNLRHTCCLCSIPDSSVLPWRSTLRLGRIR